MKYSVTGVNDLVTRKHRLDHAIEMAKNQLLQSGLNDLQFPQEATVNKEKKQLPLSRMNRLLGKSTVADGRNSTLLQQTGVAQRPSFDLLADSVLGTQSKQHKPSINLQDESDDFSGIASRRIVSLREKSLLHSEQLANEQLSSSEFVGIEDDSKPVWRSVLDGQRGRAINALPDDIAPVENDSLYHHSRSLEVKAAWPKPLSITTHRTFKQWFVCLENNNASRACESIVDSPATTLNPLMIIGQSGSGRSHLIHATAQGIARRMEGLVFLISAVDLLDLESLPQDWQDALVGASLLAIDDVDIISGDTALANQIGQMIDHAINLGVHVVLTSQDSPQQWPSSRLWDICRYSAQTTLLNPSAASMVLFCKRLAASRSISLSDTQLANIVTFDHIGWRNSIANFDKVALAIESGDAIIDGEDVIDILRDEFSVQPQDQDEFVRQSVGEIANNLISKAVDTVYSDHDFGGIDLKREIPQLADDDYQPPQWDSNELVVDDDEMLEKYVHTTLEELTPVAPSVLDVHDDERFLIARPKRIEERDYGSAADILTELDDMIDDKIRDAELEMFNNSALLSDLGERMYELAQKTGDADIEQLISIADELRQLEQTLVDLDPEREELPPFVEDKKIRKAPKRSKGKSKRKAVQRGAKSSAKAKRVIGRRSKKSVASTSESSFEDSLDSFEPQGQWNIQAQDVAMEDLLEDDEINSGKSETKVTKKIIRTVKTPITVEDEIVNTPQKPDLKASITNIGEEE